MVVRFSWNGFYSTRHHRCNRRRCRRKNTVFFTARASSSMRFVANVAVSSATLLQPSSSGGSVTYEGRFEILRLSGSYLQISNSGSCNQTGCFSVSLATPDGLVIGGGVCGMLVAANPVQVILGSFKWGGAKTKSKKPEGQECLNDSDNQSVDNLVSPSGSSPSQHPISTSPAGVWSGSRTTDMCSTHVDIDLMRG